MSDYGVGICNIEASTLYETNRGLRERYTYKRAMFTNSLLCDFVKKNGLRMCGNGYTRDIIALEFNFGTRSYEEQSKYLRKLSKSAKEENDKDKRLRILDLRKKAFKNRKSYKKLSKEEIRNIIYQDGIDVTYDTFDKKGILKKHEIIHYKMLYRSTGKAKKGTCMFICDRLFRKTYKFLTMGIKIPEHNTPIVELSAYMPLVSSTIINKIRINPKNILILKDVDSLFKTDVVSVEIDDKNQCLTRKINDYMVKNTIFDGQALIDSSIFPDWADGFILLRHHFCKMATFSANIQLFFKDYFGDDYGKAQITDMFGNKHYVKDIELITTQNAMKWCKFNVSYEYWCDRVFENNCMFGIVKTSHKSKLGDFQRMSYQMVNTLDINTIKDVSEKTVDYIHELKSDNDVFFDYLERNENFSNDYLPLVYLCKHNDDFVRSEYFRNRRTEIIRTYVKNFRRGKVIQNGDNLTMVGSPYAMLLYSVGESVTKDHTLQSENGSIQCYTQRFKDDEYIGAFRSPHNSCNNTIPLHNVYSDEMDRYFNLGKLCIAVNVQNTDIQDRANGCDFDGDTIYATNKHEIVEHILNCYQEYPTIVNNIPKEKKVYNNDLINYATVDNNISNSRMEIGESSNLAQISLTYTYNYDDEKYNDYVCILSVLAQAAIDNAKRKYDVDIGSEISRIKKDMDIKNHGYPKFWKLIRPSFNKSKINKDLVCPMNCLGDIKIRRFKSKDGTLPMKYFFVKYELNESRRKCKKVEGFIEKYSLDLYNANMGDMEEYLMMRDRFDEMIEDIKRLYFSKSYIGLMSWLIDRAFNITAENDYSMSLTRKNKSILLKVLYSINKTNLCQIFSKNC